MNGTKIRLLSSKVKSPTLLKNTLRKLRSQKKNQIVFTNGCFDIIHRGHVQYLQRARALGTHLVVALDTDSSVRKLKGTHRPINTLADRMAVIAALESVDFVTWFGGSNPIFLLSELRPDILVKGGDWKPDQILGAREVKSWGGRVKSLKFLAGRSTSQIIKKTQNL